MPHAQLTMPHVQPALTMPHVQTALTMPHAQLLSPSPCSPSPTLPPAQARELGAAFARAKELPAEMP